MSEAGQMVDYSLIVGVIGIVLALLSFYFARLNDNKSEIRAESDARLSAQKELEHRLTLAEAREAELSSAIGERHPVREIEHRLTNLEGEVNNLDTKLLQRPTQAEVEHRMTSLETEMKWQLTTVVRKKGCDP